MDETIFEVKGVVVGDAMLGSSFSEPKTILRLRQTNETLNTALGDNVESQQDGSEICSASGLSAGRVASQIVLLGPSCCWSLQDEHDAVAD